MSCAKVMVQTRKHSGLLHPTVTPCCGNVIFQCACVCYRRDVHRFICFIVAILDLYCALLRTS